LAVPPGAALLKRTDVYLHEEIMRKIRRLFEIARISRVKKNSEPKPKSCSDYSEENAPRASNGLE